LEAAYKYRIYPKTQQERLIKSQLTTLCDLYNRLRNLKIGTWKKDRISLGENDLRRKTLEIRRIDGSLQGVHSQVCQNVGTRLARAFDNYLEGRARFPKNKKPKKYRSLTYPQSGFKLCGKIIEKGKNRTEFDGRLYLSKIGFMRIFMHKPLHGKVKMLTIKHEAGEWYAIFICNIPTTRKKPIEQIQETRIKGGDIGLLRFLTLSDGETINPPNYLRREENKIKRLQRVLSRAKRGSRNRRKIAFRLARLHHHVACQRENHQNQTIAGLYKNNDVIILEKLAVANMMRNHHLTKSIQDASPGTFIRKNQFKANLLGKWFIPVDPWGTTQFCHKCLTCVPKDLGKREHTCPNCGTNLPRDENSAKLVKKLGLTMLRRLSYAPGRGVNTPVESEPLLPLKGIVSEDVEAGSPRF